MAPVGVADEGGGATFRHVTDGDTQPKHSDLSRFTRRALVVIGILLAVVAVTAFLFTTFGVALLLFLSVLLALLLDTLASFAAKHAPVSRGVALAFFVLLLLGAFTAGFYTVAPELGRQFVQILERAPEGIEAAREWLAQRTWGDRLAEIASPENGAEQLSLGNLRDALFTTFGIVGDTIFVFATALYLAANPGVYKRGIVSLVPPEGRERAGELLGTIWHELRHWLLGQFASMAIIGLSFGIGLAVLGVNLALALGVIAAIVSFVPIVGAAIAVVPALAVAVVQGPELVVPVLGMYAVIQLVESNVLTPLIQQKVINMPPVLLLTAQVVMYLLTGPLGVIVATPLTLVVMILVRELYIGEFLGTEPLPSSA